MSNDDLRALAEAALPDSGKWFPETDAAFIRATSPDRILTLLDELDALREALQGANAIVSMTRIHLTTDHPDCAYDVLGILNDAGREALVSR